MTDLLVLCTGNAARSVMAGYMLEALNEGHPDQPLRIVTGGTHTVDGQPMSLRTRTAFARLPELADADFRRHRSKQVYGVDLVHAELVVAMEADHVRFVRRRFPDAAAKTATIRHLCRVLTPPPPDLATRVKELDLATVEVDDVDDVLDPAGQEGDVYAACVDELWGLCQQLFALLCTRADGLADLSSVGVHGAQTGPGQVGHAPGQLLRLLVERRRVRSLLDEAAAGALGHADDAVGQQAAVVVVEPGVDQGVDGLGDGVLHGSQGPTQLLVVSMVSPVEQPEFGLVAHHQAEVGGEAELYLLAGALGSHDRLAHCRQQV